MEYVRNIFRDMVNKMEKNSISSAKNYQSETIIKEMYSKAFNKDSNNINIAKLSGGLKNAVYLIEDDGKKVVLKISSLDETKMIKADRNILWWEYEMLKVMEKISFPSPKPLYYDGTCTICNSPYIFMSYIEGKNYLEVKEGLTEEERKQIEFELGQLSSKICSIKRDNFFLPSFPNKKFNNNHEFVKFLFDLLLEDAKSYNVDLEQSTYDMIDRILNEKKESLNNISNLCLTHTDIWDGNILVNNGQVSGVVDFTDLYYCDELMTFYFHTIDGQTSPEFLKGFNEKELTYDEKVRIEIYRMYVILKMIVDCKMKQYGRFNWMYENLDQRITSIEELGRKK